VEFNRVTLSFKGRHAHLERRFLDDYFKRSLTQVRACLVLGILVYTGFAFSDTAFYPEVKNLVLTVRFSVVVPALIGLYILSLFPSIFRRYWQASLVAMMGLGVAGLATVIIGADEPARFTYYPALILALIWGYLCVRLRFIWASLTGMITLSIYVVSLGLLSRTPPSVLINTGFDLAAANVMCMFAAYFMEYFFRRQYYLADLLGQEQDKVKKINQELEALVEKRTSSLLHANQELEQEVAERKKAEEALTESEARYRLVVENAHEGILIIQEGGVVFHNQRLTRITGLPKTELDSKPFIELVLADYRETVLGRHQKIMAGRRVPDTYIIRVKGQNGEARWVQITEKLIQWQDSPGILCFLLDITDLKLAEIEKEKFEEQLRQTQKMEAIGTLAGGIAHDFNNILVAIMGYTELALANPDDQELRQQNLEQVLQASERAKNLVKQILSFSRRTEQERKPLQLGLIINEALKLLRASIPKTIEIKEDIETGSDTVLGDPNQIHQLLVNLCTNAAYAMRDQGGVLEVGLSRVELDEKASADYLEIGPGRYHRLRVRDTGQGMDQDTLKRIFEPFFTTKDQGEGTGMGLAVVHGIVKSHGGAITVTSQPGQGSSFEIFLPLLEKETSGLKPEAWTPVPTGNEHILFVDDELFIVDIYQQILTNLGYKVTVRTSPIEALEVFRADPQAFDIVLTDQTMPKMTGTEMAKQMFEIRPDLPMILCTGFSDPSMAERAQKLGIKKMAMKPLVIKEVANIIREALASRS
jgi:PAS domain S-box-containing protein